MFERAILTRNRTSRDEKKQMNLHFPLAFSDTIVRTVPFRVTLVVQFLSALSHDFADIVLLLLFLECDVLSIKVIVKVVLRSPLLSERKPDVTKCIASDLS